MQLIILIGPAGGGKSTLAKNLWPDTAIVSTDAIRKEIYGSEECQGDGALVFAEAKRRARGLLKKGEDVIFDATNCITKYRKQLVEDIIAGIDNVYIVGVVKYPSLEICLERNAARDRHVPEDVIRRMHANLAINLPEEGEFDEVIWSVD